MRGLVGIEPRPVDYGQTALVANFESSLPHADTAWQWMDPAIGILALLPLPASERVAGRLSLVWSAPHALANTLLQESPDELAARLTALTGGRVGVLNPISAVHSFPLRGVRVPRLVSDRMVLIGDAAHAMHPLAGQGMNAGFGDVAQLLKVVRMREPIRDWGDPLLWRRYERARRGAVDGLQGVVDALHWLFGPVPAPLAVLRDAGWRAAAASGWVRRWLVAQAVR
jgi:2-polyprenyl-6-methoxyphenol hydroxylase-like FAD-dependent oxidoreductase